MTSQKMIEAGLRLERLEQRVAGMMNTGNSYRGGGMGEGMGMGGMERSMGGGGNSSNGGSGGGGYDGSPPMGSNMSS